MADDAVAEALARPAASPSGTIPFEPRCKVCGAAVPQPGDEPPPDSKLVVQEVEYMWNVRHLRESSIFARISPMVAEWPLR